MSTRRGEGSSAPGADTSPGDTRPVNTPRVIEEPTRRALAFALRRALTGDVRFDPGSRHLYATDASNYRHLPAGVVLPRHLDDVVTAVRLCREHGVPITTRGAGTSLAGQATNVGVIIDTSRYLDEIVAIDPEARTARVQPGVVLDDLQRAAAPHGLRFGPDPSTHDRCTIGGMIGNDACGAHSLVHGRTVHQIRSLDVLLHDGTRLRVGRHPVAEVEAFARRGGRIGEVAAGLLELRASVGDLVRDRFPDVPRRVSGYHLDQLLHDDHLDVAKALVGTEGTCVVVLEAEVALVERAEATALVVFGYEDLAAAADHVPDLLAHDLAALEGIDAELVAGAGRPGRPRPPGLDLLPPGGGWAIAEVTGATSGEAEARAVALAAAVGARGDGRGDGPTNGGDVAGGSATGGGITSGTGGAPPTTRVVVEPAAQRDLWAVRSEGLGAVMVAPGEAPKIGGWEDAGLPPARLGAYLRDLGRLITEHGLSAAVYGHLGDGCVHTKIDFDHTTATGRETFRRFVEQACDLVVHHGGSPSGEHGDGQARAELYDRVFGHELVAAFARFKAIWDPDGGLNPGRLVDPLPLDTALRLEPLATMRSPAGWFALADDGGDLATAASRCVGVGSCVSDQGTGTMCPSWMATRDEQHSTRGRAHLLFEMLRPGSDLDGFDDDAVHGALDLCLSCKACRSECPTGVDMATYKAEVLARTYADGGRGRRRRPLHHHALGRVRWWLRAASRAPRLANLLGRSPLSRVGRRLVGVTTQRPLPALAEEPFSVWWRRRGRASGADPRHRGASDVGAPRHGGGPATEAGPTAADGTADPHDARSPVLLFVDTFTETMTPSVGRAAVEVLEAAGQRVVLAPRPVCCGRPLYDHGMLDEAVRELRRLVRVLAPAAHAGVPIVGLEPSCLAALRDELPELLHEGAVGAAVARDARAVVAATRSFAEHLVAIGWQLPTHLAAARVDAAGSPSGRGERHLDVSADHELLVHGHCHQDALWGMGADAAILDRLGLPWRDLDSGCCGLAGSFGYRAGDPYDVSVAAAERKLLPELRRAGATAAVVADGFSCRSQVAQLGGLDVPRPRHLAEVLASLARPDPEGRSRAAPSA